MTKRVIKTGVGTYVDKRGFPTWGYRGDEVDVNDEYLDEFDEINVEVGDGKPVEYERVGVEVISPSTAADQPDESDEDDEEEKPKSRGGRPRKAT